MIYPHQKMNEILDYTKKFNLSFVDYILKYEGESIIPYLYSILEQMKKTINNGIHTSDRRHIFCIRIS